MERQHILSWHRSKARPMHDASGLPHKGRKPARIAEAAAGVRKLWRGRNPSRSGLTGNTGSASRPKMPHRYELTGRPNDEVGELKPWFELHAGKGGCGGECHVS